MRLIRIALCLLLSTAAPAALAVPLVGAAIAAALGTAVSIGITIAAYAIVIGTNSLELRPLDVVHTRFK